MVESFNTNDMSNKISSRDTIFMNGVRHALTLQNWLWWCCWEQIQKYSRRKDFTSLVKLVSLSLLCLPGSECRAAQGRFGSPLGVVSACSCYGLHGAAGGQVAAPSIQAFAVWSRCEIRMQIWEQKLCPELRTRNRRYQSRYQTLKWSASCCRLLIYICRQTM